jgi:hypothetical protein
MMLVALGAAAAPARSRLLARRFAVGEEVLNRRAWSAVQVHVRHA